MNFNALKLISKINTKIIKKDPGLTPTQGNTFQVISDLVHV